MTTPPAIELLSAMITPAVLISASGTLILSTSTRLARVVDRVRDLANLSETLFTASGGARFVELRVRDIDRQLNIQTRRGRLLQRALTCFYVALGIFVGTAIAIALVSYVSPVGWLPGLLGITGMLVLFYGCMILLRETRLALTAVDSEMTFVLELNEMHRRESEAPTVAPHAKRLP
jgi:hypothetical protein